MCFRITDVIIKQAEKECGCKYAFVDTFTSQALDFYMNMDTKKYLP